MTWEKVSKKDRQEWLESTWMVGMVAPPEQPLTALEQAWNECRGLRGMRIFSSLPLLWRPEGPALALPSDALLSTATTVSSLQATTERCPERGTATTP